MVLLCFEAYLGKFTGNFSFSPKSDHLRKNLRNTQKVFILDKFEKGKSKRKFGFFKPLFFIKPVKGDKY